MAISAALPLAARPPVNAIPKPILIGSAAPAVPGHTPEQSTARIRRPTTGHRRVRLGCDVMCFLLEILASGEHWVPQLAVNAKGPGAVWRVQCAPRVRRGR